jgi:hypothetical protein
MSCIVDYNLKVVNYLRKTRPSIDVVEFLLHLQYDEFEEFCLGAYLNVEELSLLLSKILFGIFHADCSISNGKHHNTSQEIALRESKNLDILHENITNRFAELKIIEQYRVVMYYNYYGKDQKALDFAPFATNKDVLAILGIPICSSCCYCGPGGDLLACTLHPSSKISRDLINNGCPDFFVKERKHFYFYS